MMPRTAEARHLYIFAIFRGSKCMDVVESDNDLQSYAYAMTP